MTNAKKVLSVALGLGALVSSATLWSAEEVDQALLSAIGNAKITLVQGIAQVAKGPEVPTQVKFEMEGGKLLLSVYIWATGFSTAAEDNSFNEYVGDAASANWAPQEGGVRRSQTYGPVSAVSYAVVDDQYDHPGGCSEARGARDYLFGQGKGARRQACLRSHDRAGAHTPKTSYYDLMTGNLLGAD